MRYLPLLVVPFLLYNAFAFLIFRGDAAQFESERLFSIPTVSGAALSVSVGTTVILLALLLLAIEVVKAARIGRGSIVDHIFATALFVAFLLEFVLTRQAASGTFLVLTAIALIDLVCGFSVSIRTASRDVSFGDG